MLHVGDIAKDHLRIALIGKPYISCADGPGPGLRRSKCPRRPAIGSLNYCDHKSFSRLRVAYLGVGVVDTKNIDPDTYLDIFGLTVRDNK